MTIKDDSHEWDGGDHKVYFDEVIKITGTRPMTEQEILERLYDAESALAVYAENGGERARRHFQKYPREK